MQHIIRIAPLAQLPANRGVFDYAYTNDVRPAVGAVVTVPFRSKETHGVIVGFPPSSKFSLREIEPQEPMPLLTAGEVTFLDHISEQLKTNFGALAIHMIPPIGKRTSKDLLRPIEPKSRTEKKIAKLTYVWYKNHHTIFSGINVIVKKHRATGPIIITTPTQDAARALKTLLEDDPKLKVLLLDGESAPERRAIWHAITHGTAQTVIVGTNLTIWTPHHKSITRIIVDPTHHAHTQWITSSYTHREILEVRRTFFGEPLYVVAHSPDTADLDRMNSIPDLEHWPTIIDRATEDPTLRATFLSSIITDKLEHAHSILFFVPHLRESTHTVCKDCGALYKTKEFDSVACTKCGSHTFAVLGLGAKTLIKELKNTHIIDSHDDVTLLDTEEYKQISLRAPVSDADAKKVVIATVPLHAKLDLTPFDFVVDLSVDFELLHPTYSSEETLWKRLRATATHIPKNWAGTWYLQTTKSELLALKLRSTEGFFDWWHQERPLRQRFNHPPFANLDFKRKT